MLPLSLLKTAQGHQLVVELKSGETYIGLFVRLDDSMNIHLRDAICTSPCKEGSWKIPACCISKDDIGWVRASDENLMLSIAKDTEASESRDQILRSSILEYKETSDPSARKMLLELTDDPIGMLKSLPHLVEMVPELAIDVLADKIKSAHILDYLATFTSMNVTFNSIHVVEELSEKVPLPKQFVHMYVTNCTSSCDKVKDKTMQIELIKCVCRFLLRLVENKTIDVEYLYSEVQAFCCEYRSIDEVVTLLSKVKILESPVTYGHLESPALEQRRWCSFSNRVFVKSFISVRQQSPC